MVAQRMKNPLASEATPPVLLVIASLKPAPGSKTGSFIIRLLSTSTCAEGSFSRISAPAASTVTVVLPPATARTAFTRIGMAFLMETSSGKTSKPEDVTSRRYGLGGILAKRKEQAEPATADCLYPETGLKSVATAPSTEAPDGSTTVPLIVPALPRDWPKQLHTLKDAARAMAAMVFGIVFIFGILSIQRLQLQHSRHRYHQNAVPQAGMDDGVDEHILLQQAARVAGGDADRCGAGVGIHR